MSGIATIPDERDPRLDAIRGIALGGILFANLMSFFGAGIIGRDARLGMWAGEAGEQVLFAINWLVEGKFYSIFSILFGAGFALQRARAAERGWSMERFGRLFRRRMAVLIVIGVVHMYAFWAGDILTLYGVMGLLLPTVMCLSTRLRAAIMILLFCVPFATHAFVLASNGAFDPRPPFAARAGEVRDRFGIANRASLETFARGDAADYAASNVANAVVRPGTYLQSGRPAKVLALFLLGAWLTTSLLPRLDALRRSLYVTLAIGGACGLAWSWIYATIKANTDSTFLMSSAGLLQTFAYTLGTTPLALAYLAAFALLWRRNASQRALQWFIPLGRMALSVYLTQTLVQVLLFTGVGLGLAGRLSIVWLPLVAIALLALQRAACAWWLERHTQGPMERLWRSATYGRHAPAVPLVHS